MKFILIILMFMLGSCLNRNDQQMGIEELDLQLSLEWMYATRLENLKYNGKTLSRPPGVEQLVMELVIPQKGGLALKKHCVYYTASYKEKVSHFKIQESNSLEPCALTSSSEPELFSLYGLNDLKVTFANFKLSLEFAYQKNIRTIVIPMPNIEAGLIHEKYRPLQEKSMISGLKFLRLTDDSFDFASNKYLGKLSDRFSRGSAIRCHQVNNNCETVGENRCNDCRYGWYEVVDFQCPQGGSKFCGQNHCGEKNEPACPRGVKVIDPAEAGICQSDLEPVANADKILVCH